MSRNKVQLKIPEKLLVRSLKGIISSFILLIEK